MSADLLAYDPDACGCCDCLAYSERQTRGSLARDAWRYAYYDFNWYESGPSRAARWFLTSVARGMWWQELGISDYYVEVALHCSFVGAEEFSGALSIKFWAGYPTGYWDPLSHHFEKNGDPPALEYDECEGNSAFPGDVDSSFINERLSDVAARATYPLPDYPPEDQFLPRGDARLANEVFAGYWLKQGKAVAGDWGEAEDAAETEAELRLPGDTGALDAHFGLRVQRRRWYFPVPKSGWSLRVTFDIMWQPRGEEAELYDTVKWHWDKEVPGGYDPEDSETWPRSPWFELPEPEESGVYFMANIHVRCGPIGAPTAPGEISGEAL